MTRFTLRKDGWAEPIDHVLSESSDFKNARKWFARNNSTLHGKFEVVKWGKHGDISIKPIRL